MDRKANNGNEKEVVASSSSPWEGWVAKNADEDERGHTAWGLDGREEEEAALGHIERDTRMA